MFRFTCRLFVWSRELWAKMDIGVPDAMLEVLPR
jgi:hypothetical protein